MNEEFKIRRASESDSPGIVELIMSLGWPIALEKVQQTFKKISQGRLDCTYLAEEKGKLAGFVSIHLHSGKDVDAKVGKVVALAVKKEFRGHGLGQRLLEEAQNFCKNKGCHELEIATGDESEGSRRFYKKMGYQETIRYVKEIG